MQNILLIKLTICTAEVMFQMKEVFSWLSWEKNREQCLIMRYSKMTRWHIGES